MIFEQPIEMHVIFKGKVQGVGFRYTVQKHANSLGLTGTVCNLPDGTVELFVQGVRQNLDELMAKIKADFSKNSLDPLIVFYNNPNKKFNSFEILR